MESIYTAYTKTINGVPFYFVKHFQTFPEYNDVPPLLESYGMHTNFYKACRIARIESKEVQDQLLETVIAESLATNNANINVLAMQRNRRPLLNFKTWQFNLPGLLKIVNLR